MRRIVLDTNVFVSALLSQRGASFRILSLVNEGSFQLSLSVPLVLEYEDVASRILTRTQLNTENLNAILDYICLVGSRHLIHFLWRPFLRDPGDDLVLELAVAAGCDSIVTFNVADFTGVDVFGIEVVTPQEFLRQIGEI